MAVQIARLAAVNTRRGTALRVANVRAATTPIGTSRLRVSRLVGSAPVVIPVRAGPNRPDLEPATSITLTGSGAATGTWRQVAGPAVILTQTGATATYLAPPTLFGTYLEFEYAVQGQAARTGHTVLPATERAVVGGTEVPIATVRPAGS